MHLLLLYTTLLTLPYLGICRVHDSAGTFAWPAYPSLNYATAVPKPSTTTTFAAPYSHLSKLAGSQKTTTWASIASPTDHASKFGNAAWSSLWVSYNMSAPPFTTTAAPTPVHSSELIKPTPLPFTIGKGETEKYRFGNDFIWGFTGAANQVEGAVKSEGRGPSSADKQFGNGRPGVRLSGKPDITTLNYYLYKQDIARLAAAGVKSYGFSIAWSRILPFGYPGSPVNREGIEHYDDLINTILEYGMNPVVTLNHFDAPAYYASNSSIIGLAHPDFVEGFLNYAKIVLTHYADRVGTWVTFNEPNFDATTVKNWKSSYNVVMAHAKVVHFYREQIKGTGKWSLKLALANGFPLPLDPRNPKDIAASQRELEFRLDYMALPIYHGRQVPSSVLKALGKDAPRYTEEELRYVAGTSDYFAIDIYNSKYFTPVDGGTDSCVKNKADPLFPTCVNSTQIRSNWPMGGQSNGGQWYYSQHARTIFKYLSSTYPTKGGIMITEFGWSTWHESYMTEDQARADISASVFYLSILNELLKSVHEDGVKLMGILGWAYVDNWEWGQYDDRFGVQTFNNVTQKRSYKRTLFDVVDFISSHSRGH
ncbi:beta-glucosidase [Dactylonectria macrodidyma]|uniref:Beta-glucosidase n=1 Tax=Dactylonectria macrodidyma TaxID=307937 RepID=A0A9P9D1Y8_9HYPO|nr:beta-glucosidase [Dactylonectria macrodidyma]